MLMGGHRASPSKPQRSAVMQPRYKIAMALVLGTAIGALVVQGLHAQAKPPAYVIAEIDVANFERYSKEYLAPSSKALVDQGAKYLARGSKTASIMGEPPKRIVLLTFDTLE